MSLRISDPRPQHGPQPLDLAHELGDGIHADLGGEGGRVAASVRGWRAGVAYPSSLLAYRGQ